MKFKNTISTKLLFGFGIVVLGVIISSGLTYRTLEKNRKISDDINKVYSPSANILGELFSEISNSLMLAKNWVHVENAFDLDKDRFRSLYSTRIPSLFSKIDTLSLFWDTLSQGEYKSIQISITDTLKERHLALMDDLSEMDNYRDPMIMMMIEPELESGGEIYSITQNITKQLQALVNKQNEKVKASLTKMESSFDGFKTLILLMGFILLGVAVATGFLTTRALVVPINNLKAIIQKMSLGVLPEEELQGGNDETGEMTLALNQLINGLKESSEFAHEIGKGNFENDYKPLSEHDTMGISLERMADSLKEATRETNQQNWIKTGVNELNNRMRGDLDITTISRNIITFISKYIDAQIGAIYLTDKEEKYLSLTASYAFSKRKGITNKIEFGEGLVGQAAFEREMISISQVPDDYIRINSGLGDTIPRSIVVFPIIFESKVIGVIELGSIEEFDDLKVEFLSMVMETLAISLNSSSARSEVQLLLEKTQEQANALQHQQEELKQTNEELQVQQEELRVANEELEEQTIALKRSEQHLQQQQEELRVTNEELEEKTVTLEKQKQRITEKNIELEIARSDIELKAKELETTSRYKSEFLANMSHELRTPLNSLLILSQNLTTNKLKNLTPEQVESSKIIYKSGIDLLTLINEILDLSKIESGRMTINLEDIDLEIMGSSIRQYFSHVMEEKGLNLEIHFDDNLPKTIVSDRQRIDQIIKNLMSNAIKFTEKGSVGVKIFRPDEGTDLSRSGLTPENSIGIRVRDTGIGIPEDKQLAIWEAFQQADGSTSRKFGGTGLGLSISRSLAKLLQGEIKLVSQVDKGSEFTLYLPLEITEKKEQGMDSRISKAATPKSNGSQPLKEKAKRTEMVVEPYAMPAEMPAVEDDRDKISPSQKSILVVEDDPEFAKILYQLCHEKGFQSFVSHSGEEGLELAEKYLPNAILLDINLPGIDGLTVLDMLKDNSDTRHIPVHMISSHEVTIDAFKKGAIGYLTKPVKREELVIAFEKLEEFIDRKMKDLLIIEDDENLRKSIKMIIGDVDVKTTDVGTGKKAIEAIRAKEFDCMVLDLGLPDMSGFELLKKLGKEKDIKIPPVIIYTGKELTREENNELQQFTHSIIIKGVKSEERLLDETALFLHRVVSEMPEDQKKMITNLHDKEKLFEKKNILVVDDDMRNLFALTQILEDKGMNVIKAEDGKKAVDALQNGHSVDLVLMDIMMPVMDGYEAMQTIRKDAKYSRLPIIALTAKAMKEDREKCIAAGASDYLTKPVNVDKLLSLMRVWLYK
ncbi:MAG: response regulator [Bacteroidales bacterium]|nr:response regulator [Bacteroidales bacterium]MCF8456653.1 response regulator [Bacteroidales bacterium]